jgi:hypothetical protein
MAILTLQSGPSTNTIIAADTTIVGQPFLVDGIGQTLQSIYPNNSNFVAASWSATGLPPGVSLIYRTTNFGVKKIWVFTGTPTTAGNFDIFLTGIDSNGNAFNEGPFRVYVRNTLPQVAPSQSFSAKLNESFSGTLAVLDPVNAPARGLTWDVGPGSTDGPNVWAFRETIEKWGPSEWGVNGLPPGLSFNATTGAISGLPTKAGTYSPVLYLTHGEPLVQVRRISPAQYSTFTVEAGAPYIAGGQSASGKFGTAFNKTFSLLDSANRPATSWTATGLPPGLAIDSATGAVSGSPSLRGNFNVTLVATGPGGTSSPALVSISIALGAPSIQASQNFSGDRGAAFSATPVLSDIADRPVASWSASGLPLGLSISATTGEITGTPLNRETKTAMVTATGPGGVGEATAVSFTIAAAYSAPIITAGQTLSGKVGVAFSATPALTDAVERPVSSWSATGLPIWASLSATTGKITGTPQDSGTTTITLTATGPGGTDAEDIILAIAYGVPVVTSGQTFTGKVGTAFSATIALTDSVDRPATNLQFSWLPAGLALDQDTGVVSGIPTTTIAKSSSACFATGPGGTTPTATSVYFTIAAGAPIISPGQIFTGKAGSLFSRTPSLTNAANRPVTSWSGSGLPPWANLSATTGLITGTPQTSGSFLAQITATGPGGVSEPFPLSIVIESQYPSPIIRPNQTFTVALGKDVLFPIAVEDPTVRPVDSLQVVSGTLPPGTSLNSTYIVGKPTTHGTFSFDLTATGPGGVSAPVAVSIVVAVQKPLLYKRSYSSKVGQSFFEYASAFLDSAPHRPATSFAVDQLPIGLSLNTVSGNISGTPQQVTSLTSHLTATGPGGTSTPVDIAWTIAAGAPLITGGQSFAGKVGAAFTSPLPSLEDPVDRPATSWGITGLPAGLVFHAPSATIVGTPTIKGSFAANFFAKGPGGTSAVTPVSFTIAAAYSAPIITAGQSFTGKVGDVFPAITPALTDAAALPATSWSATVLPAGLAITTTTGAITGTPTQSGAFRSSISALSVEGESVESVAFTIAFGAPQIIPGQKLSIVQTEPFSAQLQGADESDRPISAWTSSDIPSWATLESDGRVHGTPPASGQFTFTVTATGPGGTDTDTVSLESSSEIPVIATTLVDAKVGVLHESFFTTTEPASMPVSFWGVTGTLPAGLSLDPTTGRLFGTPQAVGTSSVSTYAQSSVGKGSATISIAVAPGVPIVSAQEFYGAAGKDFDATLQAQDTTNRPATTWSIAPALPSGLAIDTATGKITGNLTNPVRFSATLTATGAGGTASAALTIDIGAPIIAPIDAKVDFALDAVVAFTTATITSGRSKVETWTTSSLPTGITFKDGVFLGRAQASGTYQITVTTQNKWDTSNAKVTFVVAQGAPIIAAGQKFSAKTDSKADFEVGLVNKASRPATKWTAQGTLPRGLGLSQDGRISGTPSQNFTGTITLIAESPIGKSTASIAIAIKGPIFYGDKNPVLQPGRVVKSFPSGLVMVSEVYKMRPSNEAAARSRFAQGQTLVTPSTSSTALKIFPAPDFKSQDSGFVEMVVTAYGFTGADFRRTRKRIQSAKMLTKVLEVPEGGGAPTFQGKYSESNIQILANTHTITRAVAYGTAVNPIDGAHGVTSLGGYSSVISAVIERYDVQNFGAFDEVTVTTAYEVTFTQQ